MVICRILANGGYFGLIFFGRVKSRFYGGFRIGVPETETNLGLFWLPSKKVQMKITRSDFTLEEGFSQFDDNPEMCDNVFK